MKPVLLIVDDEEEIRQLLSRHFRFQGFAVRLASCVDSAVSILDSERIDLVISDIMMPGRSGVELIDEVRHRAPFVRIIMITGYVTLENAMACMRRGAETCIFKPIHEMKELDDAVERALLWQKNWSLKLKMLQERKPES